MKKTVGTGSPQELLPCRWCSPNWCLYPFLSPFIQIFFSPSPPKPCGYCTCLIKMQQIPFSPNLYITRHALRNDFRDLRSKLAYPSAGWRRWWGWVYNKHNQNEYQMLMLQNMSRSQKTSTALHNTFNNLKINVTFEREGRTCKLVFPSVDGWCCWGLEWVCNRSTTNIKRNIMVRA
jgi:hypothetical protein